MFHMSYLFNLQKDTLQQLLKYFLFPPPPKDLYSFFFFSILKEETVCWKVAKILEISKLMGAGSYPDWLVRTPVLECFYQLILSWIFWFSLIVTTKKNGMIVQVEIMSASVLYWVDLYDSSVFFFQLIIIIEWEGSKNFKKYMCICVIQTF